MYMINHNSPGLNHSKTKQSSNCVHNAQDALHMGLLPDT